MTTNRCRLMEPDGALLSSGSYKLVSGPHACWAVVRDLDRPGRVVKRCLLDHIRDLTLELSSNLTVAGHVDHVTFDTKEGRVCMVRLTTPGLAGGLPAAPSWRQRFPLDSTAASALSVGGPQA